MCLFRKRLTCCNSEHHERKQLWACKKFQYNQTTCRLWNLDSRRNQVISCHLRLVYVFIFQQTASILKYITSHSSMWSWYSLLLPVNLFWIMCRRTTKSSSFNLFFHIQLRKLNGSCKCGITSLFLKYKVSKVHIAKPQRSCQTSDHFNITSSNIVYYITCTFWKLVDCFCKHLLDVKAKDQTL